MTGDSPEAVQPEIIDVPAEQPVDRGAAGLRGPLFVGLVHLAFWQIAPRIPAQSLGAVVLSTLISLAIVFSFTALLAREVRTARDVGRHLLASSIAIIPLRVMLVTGHILLPWKGIMYVAGLADLLFVWFAVSAGVLLSRMVKALNMIPPLAVVLALVDIWTVLLNGPVQQIMQSNNPTAQAVTRAMTVKLPAPSIRGVAPMTAVVGFADFLFAAFFIAALTRYAPGRDTFKRTLIAMIVVLCFYMLIALQFEWNLPAMVPMAIVMLILHWRRFKYTREEAFALLYAGILLAGIGGYFYWKSRPVEKPGHKMELIDKPAPEAP